MLLDGLRLPSFGNVSAAHALQQVFDNVLFSVHEALAVNEGQHHRLDVVVIQSLLLLQLSGHIFGSIYGAFRY